MAGKQRRSRTSWGQVEKRGKLYRARYTVEGVRYSAGTFLSRGDAEAKLSEIRTDVLRGDWNSPDDLPEVRTFGDYVESWLTRRDLKPRTLSDYRRYLDSSILPRFRDTPLHQITTKVMLAWYDSPEMTWYQRKDKPRQRWSARQREHRYNLLRAVLRSAEKEGLVDKAPAIDIRRRKRADRLKTLELPTVDALKVMESAMPDRLRAAVTLAAWTGLRFGELASLRRRDIDTEGMVVRVRRSVTRLSDGERRRHAEMVDPKTASGTRDVDIPPHVMPGIEAHLRDHVGLGLNALLFPGATNSEVPISEETLRYHWHKARKVAGYDELRWHDLRHLFGVLDMEATLAVGGTPADTQAHMGHADAKSTARYLHAVKSRGKLAAAMKSEIALRSVADEQA